MMYICRLPEKKRKNPKEMKSGNERRKSRENNMIFHLQGKEFHCEEFTILISHIICILPSKI